jgi:hypothetical protein
MSDLSSLLAPIRAREAAANDYPGHATVTIKYLRRFIGRRPE